MSRHYKLVTLALALALSLACAGCGDQAPQDTEAAQSAVNTENTEPGTLSPAADETPSPSESEPEESGEAAPDESGEEESESPKPSASKDYTTFDGYLLDCHCGEKGKDPAGHNMKTEPEKHTVACLKKYAKHGYGMAIRQEDGKYKFYPFDDAGNRLVKKYLVDKTKRKDNMLIAVRGSMVDGVINVKMVLAYGLK